MWSKLEVYKGGSERKVEVYKGGSERKVEVYKGGASPAPTIDGLEGEKL